ncbi:hypothetical protein EVC35_08095 [Oenococcus sicerae]|uniref:Uncharacterized protein n=1 Tax=Oenococcus sicerae TaxID=2203724 RepID=A0AAJ1RC60_9LACO|nr:hypothetical protein [Oenococcus sicerae]
MNALINKNYISHIPTTVFLVILIVTFVVAYLISYHFRNNYDPKPLICAYMVYAPLLLILNLVFLHLKWILVVGIYLTGFVVLLYRSNHYFNE